MNQTTLYDDGGVVCDDTGLLIRRYYPWGSKRVPYESIKKISRLPIRVRKWRIWGSGDFRHWWNLDPNRPKKNVALELDTGRWIRPTITPDDVDAVEAIVAQHLPGAGLPERCHARVACVAGSTFALGRDQDRRLQDDEVEGGP